MIDKALKVIVDGLNRHLAIQFTTPGPLAVLSPATGPDNMALRGATDRILVTLVNLERESFVRNATQTSRPLSGAYMRTPLPLNLNLVVLISANFPQNYEDGLSILSSVVSYFQAHPVLDRANTPSIPSGVERLSVEWRDIDLNAMSSLWAVLGGSYQPSVVYLVRMLTVDSGAIGDDAPAVTRIDVEE